MGSIRRAPRTGRWEVRYRDPIGVQRTRTFDRKGDANALLAGVEVDIARGRWSDPRPARITFAELAEQWLASNPGKRPTTLARDAMVARVHLVPVLGTRLVSQLRPSHVQAVVDRMVAKGLAPKTVKTDYGVLAAILPDEYRVAVFLGALGLRQAEVLGLRVGSIDFLRRTLTVQATVNEVEGRIIEGTGKTAASVRTFSVPQRVLDELAAHLARTGRRQPSELVLQAPNGGPVRATNFRLRVYDAALKRAGLEGLTFHRLRHSAGHMMREVGVPLEVIQRRLGHQSIRTTADIYGSLPTSVDRAVADQLDELFRNSCGAGVVQSPGESGGSA